MNSTIETTTMPQLPCLSHLSSYPRVDTGKEREKIFQSRLIILIKFLYHFDVETLIMLCLCWSEASEKK